VTEFDRRFLQEDWASAAAILHESRQFAQTFDHEFRKMLLSIYTADEAGLGIALGALRSRYGEQIVWHIYRGYCAEHAIPDRSSHT
jgi:hypothetical protein